MAKKESTFVNMVVVLLIISVIAATSLAYVYKFTKDPIAKAKSKKEEKAISQVVPAFDNKPFDEQYSIPLGENDSLMVFPAKKGEELVGYAVKTFSDKGFGGRISLIVGFDKDGVITGTKVLDHKETPGLGDKTVKEKTLRKEKVDGKKVEKWWAKQFIGKKPKFKVKEAGGKKIAEAVNIKVTKDGGEIDAITASTISSRAFCDAVNRAAATYNKTGELQGKAPNNVIHYVLFIFLAFGLVVFGISKLKI